jgi:hypothetical protein
VSSIKFLRNEIVLSTIAGAMPGEQANAALQAADQRVKDTKDVGLL